MQSMWSYRLEVVKAHWDGIALGLGLLALLIGSLFWLSARRSLPATVERGVVLRFGGTPSDVGDRLLVVARAADGSVHQLPARFARIRRCRVGGTIMLVRRGGRISGLAWEACRIDEGVTAPFEGNGSEP